LKDDIPGIPRKKNIKQILQSESFPFAVFAVYSIPAFNFCKTFNITVIPKGILPNPAVAPPREAETN